MKSVFFLEKKGLQEGTSGEKVSYIKESWIQENKNGLSIRTGNESIETDFFTIRKRSLRKQQTQVRKGSVSKSLCPLLLTVTPKKKRKKKSKN